MYTHSLSLLLYMGNIIFSRQTMSYFPKFTDTPINVFGICTDWGLFTKFFLTNTFYLYGLPKFSPPNISCVRYMQTRKYCLYILVLYNTTLVLQCVASVFLPLNKHYIKFLFIQSSQSYVSFILESSEACKDIWKTCIEHHTFFKLHKPPEPQKKTFFKRGSKFTYR